MGPLKTYCASCIRATYKLGGNKLFTTEIYPLEDVISSKFVTNLRDLLVSSFRDFDPHFCKTLLVFLGVVFLQYLGV